MAAPILPFSARLVLTAAFCAGCSRHGAKEIPRDPDAAAVVILDRGPGQLVLASEREPNDGREQANTMALPGGARGSLQSSGDLDLYRVAVPSDGYLTALLAGVEGVDLVLELRDAKGALVVQSDRGADLVSEGLPNVPVLRGDYYLVVREFVKRSRRSKKDGEKGRPGGASPPYELSARHAVAIAHEHEVEPNETPEDAAELFAGEERFGFIGWAQDRDVWRLLVSGLDPMDSAELDVTGVEGVSLRAELHDGAGRAVLKRAGGRSRALAVRNLVPTPSSGEVYTLHLSASRSNPEQRYRLRFRRRPLGPEEEWEPNDEPIRATPLRTQPSEISGIRRGFLTAGDVDYFRLHVAGASAVTLAAEPPRSVDIAVAVVSDKGETIAEANAAKRGSPEELKQVNVQPGTVFVRVSGAGDADDPDYYILRWSVASWTAAAGLP